MNTYRLITVHDWYDSSRRTRIRCQYAKGVYYCSKRQKRDAIRRARVMSGSVLRSTTDCSIFVFDDEGLVVDYIQGC